MLIVYLAILGLSFYLLYFFSENYFIPSLDVFSRNLKMSSDMAGATLMAIGSSAPELAVVIFSIIKSGNHEAIGVGTVVGSALFNLFVIVGGVMIINNKAKMIWQPLARDLIFYAVTVILFIAVSYDGVITIFDTSLLLIAYICYLSMMYYINRKRKYYDKEGDQSILEPAIDPILIIDNLLLKIIPRINNLLISFLISIVFICFLSWILVESAIQISLILEVPEVIIALTIIAIGTSIPDLMSSLIVAKKGRPGMAINNAIGSNIFDILVGLSLPLLLLIIFTDVSVQISSVQLGVSFILLMSSILILGISLIWNKWITNKNVGVLLIVIYITYIIHEITSSIFFIY